MEALFMNSENCETSNLHRLLLKLKDKINSKRSDRYTTLSNLSICYTWKNIKMSNNEFKISAPTCIKKFELPDGLYSVSYNQGDLSYTTKKHQTVTNNPLIRIYVNKIENRITFKIKTVYCGKRLTSKTMKLLGRTKRKITKDKNSENMTHLEITKVVLFHCNIVNNDCQQDSRVLYTLVPNKSFGQLLDISPESFIFLKIFNSEFSYIEVWLTD